MRERDSEKLRSLRANAYAADRVRINDGLAPQLPYELRRAWLAGHAAARRELRGQKDEVKS